MFQLGYIDYVWDPFFGFQGGTEKVLNSDMSHMWPISDGGLGTISYTFEFLMGYMGSPSRWRTMPWMVAFFGMLVIPLGLTHIILMISQPVIVHHWCSMCLLAALIMLPMLPLEVDEVVAMCQHVRQAKQRGDRGGSFWAIFWKGGNAEGCTDDDPAPAIMELPAKPWQVFKASIWGMSFPWTLFAATVLGVVVMFLPTWFGVDIHSTAADIGHLGGALIVTVSVICMGEVVRIGRYLNLLLAIAVGVGPWIVQTSSGYAITCSILAAIVLVLSIPRPQDADLRHLGRVCAINGQAYVGPTLKHLKTSRPFIGFVPQLDFFNLMTDSQKWTRECQLATWYGSCWRIALMPKRLIAIKR